MSLFVVGQLFSYLQRMEYLEQVTGYDLPNLDSLYWQVDQTIQLMEKFNGAELAINLLRDPTTPVEGPSIFSHNFFFPKIEQFRYINISQTNFHAIRDQLLLDPSAISLTAQTHVTNVGFTNHNVLAAQFAAAQPSADVGFIFSENLLQVPSPPQTYHDSSIGTTLSPHSETTNPTLSTNNSAIVNHSTTHLVNNIYTASLMSNNNNNYAADMGYDQTPPMTSVKNYYVPQSHEEPQAKRQRVTSYADNMTVITHWTQHNESRAPTSTSSNDEESSGPTGMGSEEEYLSPEQYSVLTNTDLSQVPVTLDQMALMYYNQNFNATSGPLANSQYDTRIQPLPPNSMYYNQ